MAETPQLEAAYSRDYQSRSAPIKEVDACNKQGTKARGHLAMPNKVMSQGEEGEQNRMAGGGAGQHTTWASKTLPIAGAMSPSGHVTWTHTPRDATSGISHRRGPRGLQVFYGVKGSSRTNIGNRTSMSDTLAAAATETTPPSTGCKRSKRDWP